LSGIVLDASVTLAWCFADEDSDYANRVLSLLEQEPAQAPSLWSLEVANALLAGERRKRLTTADVSHFAALLDDLPIEFDQHPSARVFQRILPLARSQGLSVYDATYLELAMRTGSPLASLDYNLKTAAKAVGVEVFTGY
jgi:predicted nucleic acid-binding protein